MLRDYRHFVSLLEGKYVSLPSQTMKPIKNPFRLSNSSDKDRLSEIYRVAARIICEKGFDATSMSDIAEAVGITKAGIYHHIPGKKDLLFRIMNFGMDSLDEQVIAPSRDVRDMVLKTGMERGAALSYDRLEEVAAELNR